MEPLEKQRIMQMLKEKDTAGTLDWMYSQDTPNAEDYLLGKRVDKHIEGEGQKKQDDVAIFNERITANIQLDMQAKMREDPLFAIRKKEVEAKKELLNNPVKMKRLQKMLESQKEETKKKKKKKGKKKKKKRGSDSESEDDDEDEQDDIMQSYLSVLSKKHSAAAAGGSGAGKPPQRGGRRGGRNEDGASWNAGRQWQRPDGRQHRNQEDRSWRRDRDSDQEEQDSYERRGGEGDRPPHRQYGLLRGRTEREEDLEPAPRKRRTSDSLSPPAHRHRSRSRSPSRKQRSDWRSKGSPPRPKKHKSRSPVARSSRSSSASRSKLKSRRRSKSRSPSRRSASPPKRKLTDEERQRRLEEMMDNAKWREEQRKTNVQRYEAEAKREESSHRQHAGKAGFISSMMSDHADKSSVEDRLRRNKYNIQRTNASLNKNFTKQ